MGENKGPYYQGETTKNSRRTENATGEPFPGSVAEGCINMADITNGNY